MDPASLRQLAQERRADLAAWQGASPEQQRAYARARLAYRATGDVLSPDAAPGFSAWLDAQLLAEPAPWAELEEQEALALAGEQAAAPRDLRDELGLEEQGK